MLIEVGEQVKFVLLWGFVASGAMAVILEGSRQLGLSRMSLPFLFGTFFTGKRSHARIVGFFLYLMGGWIFAAGYALVFTHVGTAGWLLGGGLGLAHGLWLLLVFLPLLPAAHPRMATEHQGPDANRRIEPPGLVGLNYGRRTPLITLAAQVAYGGILGAFHPLAM